MKPLILTWLILLLIEILVLNQTYGNNTTTTRDTRGCCDKNNSENILYREYRYSDEIQTRAITADISAYTLSAEETDEDFSQASCGYIAYGLDNINYIACPSYLSCGTRVEIDGMIYTCWDRMNIRYRNGNYFDILFPDKQSALDFGRQIKEVKIIK